MYYLNNRFYDQEIGRFINADTVDLVLASQTTLTDKNLYAYCDNNPVVRKDAGGAIWETAFDVISLAASIAEVAADPTDVWAWAGLAGDAIDLIPVVTGAGEVVRSLKAVNKIDDISDTIGITNKVSNTVDDTKIIVEKITGYTKHGLEQAIGRNGIGVAPNAILDAVRNPKKTVSKIDDLGRHSTQYRGVKATVVLNPAGKIVSCWAKSSKYGRIK